MKKFCLLFAVLCFSLMPLFAEDSSSTDSVQTDALPEWVHTTRRAEIITFGSLPFTTLWVSLAYGTYEYATGKTSSFPNPLDKSSSGYDTDEIKKIVGVSLGVSGVLALADFIIGRIKKNRTLANAKEAHAAGKDVGVLELSEEELKLRKESVTITSTLPEDIGKEEE